MAECKLLPVAYEWSPEGRAAKLRSTITVGYNGNRLACRSDGLPASSEQTKSSRDIFLAVVRRRNINGRVRILALALEADFTTTSRFVEVTEKNCDTYSIEYVNLLLATASEIDVLCKLLCENLDPTAKSGNIDDYRLCISACADLHKEKVLLRAYDLELTPWAEWAGDSNPNWWQSYNNVKHERDKFYPEANLGNCVNALAALFILVLFLHKAEDSDAKLEPLPQLLGRDPEPGSISLQAGYVVPEFKTPNT